ncbi:MAG: SDR family oxidoreductase [Bacteroidota bacterium]
MKNKVVIITGASSGIGKATAEEFAMRGAKVVLAARNLEKLEELAIRLKSKGLETLPVKTDVSIEEDCKNLIEKTIDAYGKIDVLINNAGISMRALFEEVDLSVIKRMMDVNFWGAVYCTKYAMPYLLKVRGSVAGVSSIGGYRGLPGRTGYSASKFAVRGFLQALRTENRKHGLNVLIINPWFTASNIRNTALTKDNKQQISSPRDEKKMMQSKEVARYIYKAVINRNDTLTITLLGKLTRWFNEILPRSTDRVIYKIMSKEPDSPFK